MNLKDVKIGETYNVRVKVDELTKKRIITYAVTEDGSQIGDAASIFFEEEVAAFTPINLYEPLKLNVIRYIPETAPKYDPNRPFREKDIVRYKPLNGRECPAMPCDEFYREKTLTVVANEDCNHRVLVQTQDGREKYIMFCYLELVTPVEEIEPYIVSNDDTEYSVFDQERKLTVCRFDICHPNAETAAEAECARLNSEYRKELCND